MARSRAFWGNLIPALAWLSLLAAFILGQIATRPDHSALVTQAFPKLSLEQPIRLSGGEVFKVSSEQQAKPGAGREQPVERLLVGRGDGYGGPLLVAVTLWPAEGEQPPQISEVKLLTHIDGPPFIASLDKQFFWRQFRGKPITDNFLVGDDIDGYSGATVSAKGISQAVGGVVHAYASERLKLPVSWQVAPWKFGLDEVLMLLLVICAIYISVKWSAGHKLASAIRVIMPLASLIFVGYYVNMSISIGSLSSIVLGYVPSPRQFPMWWILMSAVILSVVVMGNNVYCNKICPFHAAEQLLAKISGLNFKIAHRFGRHSRNVIFTLTWAALMLIFLSHHPALGSFEPFSMMFGLDGLGLQWYILPLSLIGAFFVPSFWCRYFCPVGLVLNESVRVRRKLLSKRGMKVTKPRPERAAALAGQAPQAKKQAVEVVNAAADKKPSAVQPEPKAVKPKKKPWMKSPVKRKPKPPSSSPTLTTALGFITLFVCAGFFLQNLFDLTITGHFQLLVERLKDWLG